MGASARAWDAGNLLDYTPKRSKVVETSGDGRQNETIWEMSDEEEKCHRIRDSIFNLFLL